MKPQDPETEASRNELAFDRWFANCFCAVWYCIAVIDRALGWVCGKIKRKEMK